MGGFQINFVIRKTFLWLKPEAIKKKKEEI